MASKINWDALGVSASIACAIHCAILPLIITSLPLFGFNIIDNPAFEYGMICLAFLIGCYSLFHGFRHHHKRILPLLIFIAGIAFLVSKQVFHQFHIWLLFPALIAIVTAHYLNYRFGRNQFQMKSVA